MLTRRDIFNRIDEIIERAYLGFLFEIAGADFFTEEQKRKIEGLGLIIGRRPLLELLYILIRNRPTEGYRKDFSLNMLLDQVASTGILPLINDTQQATIDTAKIAIHQALDNAKNELKKQIKQNVIEANKKVKQETEVRRYTSVPDVKRQEQKHTAVLLAALADVGKTVHKTFTQSFTTELTSFINSSTVDQIAEQTLLTGEFPGETKVYKVVNNDHKLCQWCHKFYTHKGKPVIFTLAELQANGTNYGKPKKDWKPVLGATHPRCRCQLHILKK